MKLSDTILGPVLTEKAVGKQKAGVYSFWVNSKANKNQISLAVKQMFGVEPEKVRTIMVKGKSKLIRRKNKRVWGKKRKKVLVQLSSGDKIDL